MDEVSQYLKTCAVGLAAGAIAKVVSDAGPAWLRPHAGLIARGIREISMRPLLIEELLRPVRAQPIWVQDPVTGTWQKIWPLTD